MQVPDNRILNGNIYFAFLTLLFIFINLFFSAFTLLCGYTIGPWILAASILITIFLGVYFKKPSSTALFLGAFLISLLLGYFSFDTTFDSISYHKPTIEALVGGWNPIYDEGENLGMWTLHYARGLELQASSIASYLGIEASKSINFLFFFATFSLSFCGLYKSFASLSKKQVLIATFVLMLNPVVLSQLFTFYNDSYLYLECVSLVSLFILLYKSEGNRSVYYFMLLTVTLMAVNTKFTHFFFGCLLWGGFWVYLSYKKNYKLLKKSLILGVIALAVGVGFIGFNPYVTNFVKTGDPFYPLLSNQVDIMTTNTPEILKDDNRFIAFVKAQLSNEDIAWSLIRGKASVADIIMPSADSRTFGFGILFFPIFLCSLTLMIMTRADKKLWIALVLILLPIAFFEQSWWARYIPFPWAVATLAVISYYQSKKLILQRIFYAAIISMVIFTACIAMGRNASRRIYAHFNPEIAESLIQNAESE